MLFHGSYMVHGPNEMIGELVKVNVRPSRVLTDSLMLCFFFFFFATVPVTYFAIFCERAQAQLE